MKIPPEQFDADARALEKQASRNRDAARLVAGAVSPQDLRRENSIASHIPLHRYQMSTIGGKPVTRT